MAKSKPKAKRKQSSRAKLQSKMRNGLWTRMDEIRIGRWFVKTYVFLMETKTQERTK